MWSRASSSSSSARSEPLHCRLGACVAAGVPRSTPRYEYADAGLDVIATRRLRGSCVGVTGKGLFVDILYVLGVVERLLMACFGAIPGEVGQWESDRGRKEEVWKDHLLCGYYARIDVDRVLFHATVLWYRPKPSRPNVTSP